MTSDVEELLREGISRLTDGAEAPAGLVGRARARNRQRRVAIRAGTAAGAAVVAAVAAIAVVGASPRTGALREQTISYVTSRTQHALSAVAQGKYIEEVQATAQNASFGFTVINMALSAEPDPTGPAALPGVLANVHAQRMVLWNYQGSMLQEGFTAGGQPVFNATLGTVPSAAGKKVLEAYGAVYPARTQWRSRVTGGPNWPAPALTCENALAGSATANWAAVISKALSCHRYVLGGRAQIDGVTAIKLTMKPEPGLSFRQTLWVDPSTYLPVRVSTDFQPGGRHAVLVQNYRWLPPNAAGLAALHAAIRQAVIPAGFRMLPSTDLPLPDFGQAP
jgi:hypothetical protein